MYRRSNRLLNKNATSSSDMVYFRDVCAKWKRKYNAAKEEVNLLNVQIANCQKEINDAMKYEEAYDRAYRAARRIRWIITYKKPLDSEAIDEIDELCEQAMNAYSSESSSDSDS